MGAGVGEGFRYSRMMWKLPTLLEEVPDTPAILELAAVA